MRRFTQIMGQRAQRRDTTVGSDSLAEDEDGWTSSCGWDEDDFGDAAVYRIRKSRSRNFEDDWR